MKNRITRTALMVAMVRAIGALRAPRSMDAISTVRPVATSSAIQTAMNIFVVGPWLCGSSTDSPVSWVCRLLGSVWLIPFSLRVMMMADEVEQWEKINPHHVYKVPVKPGHLNRRVVFRSEVAFLGANQQPGEQADSDDHVQRVHASHAEVEREEDCDMARICISEFARMPVQARYLAGVPVVRVLDGLDT